MIFVFWPVDGIIVASGDRETVGAMFVLSEGIRMLEQRVTERTGETLLIAMITSLRDMPPLERKERRVLTTNVRYSTQKKCHLEDCFHK